MKARFALSELPRDLQELICEHTEAIFAVESDFTIRLRFPEVGWTSVPHVIRYELLLAPRDLRSSPEIQVTLTRFLHPAFKHSRLFRDSDACMQDALVSCFRETTFSSVSAVRLEVRHDCAEQQHEFLRFVSRKNGVQHAFHTPFWGRIERDKIDEVREKLESVFRMELEAQGK